MADAQGCHAQQGQANAGDEKAQGRDPHLAARLLAHGHREDQVPRAKEHAEEHTGHGHVFSKTQLLFHSTLPLIP